MDIYEKITAFYTNASTEKRIIGKSLFGRNIYAVKIGEGRPVGIAQYGIHGREYITALLAVEHYKHGLFQGSFWLLPLANPDGALLCQCGLDSVSRETDREYLLCLNDENSDFSLWKANARGVDLNVNFAAEWGKGVKNLRVAGAENYIGEKPFSEPETLALKDFTQEIAPNYTVSYHTKGEEIYWYFRQSGGDCVRDKNLALVLARSTGYPLAYAKGSVGGYKDWCIQSLKIPSFTVETGSDLAVHPLTEKELPDIIEKNVNSLYDLSKEYCCKR